MGTWAVVTVEGKRRLVLHDPDLNADWDKADVHLSENEVAKLLLFLQGRSESWALTRWPPDSSPDPAVPGPGP